MNIFTVYDILNQDNRSPLMIKQGFSFNACVFGPFWALYHKMWGIALLYFILNTIIAFNPFYFDSAIFSCCFNIVKLFLFGFFAPDLQEYYARRKGYVLTDIILAGSWDEAEVKYFTRKV